MKTLNLRGTLLDVSSPTVMGIINVTPDSFYAGSRVEAIENLLAKAGTMLEQGATFLDIGGYSSRPDADDIAEGEEIKRVIEPIRQIKAAYPQAIISIDTFRATVAAQAIASGADIINDISGGNLDPKMHALVGDLQVPYIGMHMRGTPQTMRRQNTYEDMVRDIVLYFADMLEKLERLGAKDVVIDPGFGFAKNITQNFELLKSLAFFQHLERPLLVGLSRKSMIYRTLGVKSEEALNGTTVLNTVALLNGASILRVHDVKEAIEAVRLVEQIRG